MDVPYTPSQTIGPFFAIMLPLGSPALVDPTNAAAITLEGTVYDGEGDPVTDALLEVWQPIGDGQQTADPFSGFGRCLTDTEGRFRFVTVKPARVAYIDERLQAPHISLSLFARGLLKRVVTRIYFADEPSNANDPVLLSVEEARRHTLLALPCRPRAYSFHVRLQGEDETVFFAV